MVTNIRKGITVLLAVIMVFALAACGNTNSTSNKDSEKQNSASQNTQNTSEANVTTTEKQAMICKKRLPQETGQAMIQAKFLLYISHGRDIWTAWHIG